MASHSETEALYHEHGPALVRKAERMLLSTDDAHDVVHGLFVDVMQKRTKTPDLPYLYRAVTNRCINLIRDRSTRQRLLEQRQTELRGPSRSPLDDQLVDLDLLTKLVDYLDRKTLEVVVCCFIDDMSHAETATLLGVSERTVGSRVRKARHRLTRLHEAAHRSQA